MNILIVGGGLAGMSSAIALGEAGARVTLIEADSNWGALGAGLSLNGASMRALRELGVLDEVERRGFTHDVRQLFDAEGNLQFTSSSERIFGPDVPNGGAIMRPVLHDLLLERIEALGITVRKGVAASRVVDAEAGVVELANGETLQGDMVLCADGFWSPMRHQLFPDAPASQFTGQGCWRAVVDRPADIQGASTFIGEYKVGVNPVSQDQMYMFLLENKDEDEWIEESQWLERLKGLLSGFGGLMAEIRNDLGPQNQVNYRPLKVHVVPAPWHKGRFVLIGDSAHATTPHAAYGAGLAFEDALCLAGLYRANLPVSELLERFTAARYDKCKAVVEGSVAIGDIERRHGSMDEYRKAFEAVQTIVRDWN
ncbi:FAD-dependent monooxygenase [Novosphingobium profundi]|uniref:FAD-dependent monooxygenase n=1 Tax=Novosphingobium profundi TaxID=1774954 RepID=UPI001BD9B97C|nr:FAD-dependent monooxygenase [Novosphingobium profundi]MBT0670477.1 FAD-dependent monooxygenase [Novosphingobium profundi]